MAGRKVFTREVLSSADVNGLLMDQTVMRFATSNARAAAIPAPEKNTVTALDTSKRLERYDGSAWRILSGVPTFATVAARDAYFAAPNNAPVAGDQCQTNGVLMTHDGTAWRFVSVQAMGGVGDANGNVVLPHGWGQVPVVFTAVAGAGATDQLSIISKAVPGNVDATNVVVRHARTDTSAWLAGNGLNFIAVLRF